jgi:hypothetical protein
VYAIGVIVAIGVAVKDVQRIVRVIVLPIVRSMGKKRHKNGKQGKGLFHSV